VASYPFLARLAAENKIAEMTRLINETLKYLALVIPFAALLIVLRSEIILILFQRGKFNTDSTALTSQVLGWLLLGAYGFAAQTVVVRGFYALKNTLLPAIYTTVAVVLSLPLYALGLNLYGASGIAMAIALSVILQVWVLYAVWTRRHGASRDGGVYRTILTMVLISLPLGLLLNIIKSLILRGIDAGTWAGCLLICLIIGTIFLVILLGMGYGLKLSPINELIQLRRKSKPQTL
jgi:putative peptidoglycan lipid II flippase